MVYLWSTKKCPNVPDVTLSDVQIVKIVSYTFLKGFQIFADVSFCWAGVVPDPHKHYAVTALSGWAEHCFTFLLSILLSLSTCFP